MSTERWRKVQVQIARAKCKYDCWGKINIAASQQSWEFAMRNLSNVGTVVSQLPTTVRKMRRFLARNRRYFVGKWFGIRIQRFRVTETEVENLGFRMYIFNKLDTRQTIYNLCYLWCLTSGNRRSRCKDRASADFLSCEKLNKSELNTTCLNDATDILDIERHWRDAWCDEGYLLRFWKMYLGNLFKYFHLPARRCWQFQMEYCTFLHLYLCFTFSGAPQIVSYINHWHLLGHFLSAHIYFSMTDKILLRPKKFPIDKRKDTRLRKQVY